MVQDSPEYPLLSDTTPRFPPHSHSIILSYGNALNFRRKFFLYAMKNRLADPSEICALDFNHEFGRSAVCSVSATIGIDRSILADSARTTGWTGSRKKTVSPSSDDQLDENLAIGYLTACFVHCQHISAGDRSGTLLHKHPGGLHEIEQTFGKAWVFYPDASDGRCEAALVLDVDPVGLVPGKDQAQGPPDQYVNDRPDAALSFLSVALGVPDRDDRRLQRAAGTRR
jgi:hypothetical protein